MRQGEAANTVAVRFGTMSGGPFMSATDVLLSQALCGCGMAYLNKKIKWPSVPSGRPLTLERVMAFQDVFLIVV